jgi:hypothetical protein
VDDASRSLLFGDPSKSNPLANDPTQSAASNLLGGLNSQSRGIRNNNPGNLEANDWTSSLPGYQGSDGRFAKFATPEQGLDALDRNLQSYAKLGINTPAGIAGRWAPTGENDSESYGMAIARDLGIKPTDKIDMSDVGMRNKIAGTIARIENGLAPNGIKPSAPSASPASATVQGSQTPAGPLSEGGDQSQSNSMHGLYTMALLQNLYPQHKFSPVDYDPFAVQPKGIKS